MPRVAPGVIIVQPLQGWANLKLNAFFPPSLLPYYLTPLLVFVFSSGLPDFRTSGLCNLSCSIKHNLFRLNSISLYQFKNHPSVKFRFTERLIGICGKNGVGKTNLLDAIYYSCFTKSYFSKSDAQTVLQGAMGFRLEAAFEKNGMPETFVCILRETGKKECLVNDKAYTKLSKHIGRFPSVMICPDDIQIITGGSEERRRYLDALISQLDPIYLQHLIGYTKVLQQRNGYLKGLVDKRQADTQLLDVYDKQLCEHANYIYRKRMKKK